MIPSIAIPVEAANDDMKQSSVRASVKVTTLVYSMESSIPKIVLALLASEPTVPIAQSLPKSCLSDHQKNRICHLKGQKRELFRTPKSSRISW